jgi:hypothetical protein
MLLACGKCRKLHNIFVKDFASSYAGESFKLIVSVILVFFV